MVINEQQRQSIRKLYDRLKPNKINLGVELYEDIVKEYLKLRPRKAYYKASYEIDDAEYEYLKPLTDENVEEISSIIKQLDPNDEYDFEYVLSDEIAAIADKEYLYQTNELEQELTLTYVDLNKKYYCYGVTLAIFNEGLRSAPTIDEHKINIPEEEYVYLLAKALYTKQTRGKEFTLNLLRIANEELYNGICNTIDIGYFGINNYPNVVPKYAVELTEVNEDVELLASIINEELQTPH